MSSRFSPRGGIQSTFGSGIGPVAPNAADIVFGIQQQSAFDECNKLVAGVSFFLPSGIPDAAKIDRVQTQLQGVNVPITAATLPAGTTALGWSGQIDWAATLAARKAALATF